MNKDKIKFEQVIVNDHVIELIDKQPLDLSIELITDDPIYINPNLIKIKFGTHDFYTTSCNKDSIEELFNNINEYVNSSNTKYADYQRFIKGLFDTDIEAILCINITRRTSHAYRFSNKIGSIYFEILIKVYPKQCSESIYFNERNYIVVNE